MAMPPHNTTASVLNAKTSTYTYEVALERAIALSDREVIYAR